MRSLSPPSTREQERALLTRAHAGDVKARDELVMRNMRFVFKTAKQVAKSHHNKRGDYRVEYDDLVQEGLIALMRAVNQFDLDHCDQVRFITYAARAVIHEIHRRANRAFDLLKTPCGAHRERLLDELRHQDPDISPSIDVHAAVDKLSPKTRDVIERHYFNDEEYKDIAVSYGVCTQRIHQIARDGVRELGVYLER